MAKVTSGKRSVGRRGFIKGAAAGAAALAAHTTSVVAQQPVAQAPPPGPAAAPPSSAQLARDTSATPPTVQPARFVENPQSDYMVDVIRALGFDYAAANPGSSFEGLHESIINYGDNKAPEFLTALHEESSVAMAHGYAKVEGRPMLVLLHGVIGIQHGSMAIYNAYCDRVPIFMIAGVDIEGAVPAHNATDMANMTRGYVKWDYQPDSLAQFTTGMFRAYKLMMTPPMAPVLLVADSRIQKDPITQRPPIGKLVMPSPPAADLASVREIARMLVAAQNPRVNAGRAVRTDAGLRQMVELAELLQMPVNVGGDRINFPSHHPLGGNGAGQADLILMLEAAGGGGGAAGAAADVKRISISTAETLATANYNVLGNPVQADLVATGDPEATLPSLIEEVKKLVTADRRAAFEQRGKRHADANRQARQQFIDQARYGWDSSPISTARITAELWPLIKNEDWSLVSPANFFSSWPLRLWEMSKTYQLSWRAGRRWHGLRRAGGGGRGAGAAEAWPAADQHPVRRRSELRARCAVDRRPPSDPAAHRHAQQPRLSPGSDVRAADVRGPQPWREERAHRDDLVAAEHRLRADGQELRYVRGRADREPEGSGARLHSRDCARQERRAGAHRRRHAATVKADAETLSGVAVRVSFSLGPDCATALVSTCSCADTRGDRRSRSR